MTEITESDISQDANLLRSTEDALTKSFKDVLMLAEESGLLGEIQDDIKKYPEAAKSYTEFKTNKALQTEIMAREMDTITNNVLTMQIDPHLTQDSIGYYDFPYERVLPEMLRRAGSSIPCRMIKQFRNYQLAEFANSSDGKEPGFKLIFNDPDRKVTDAEKKKIKEWEDIFAHKFFFTPNNPEPSLKRWMIQSYNDFFDLDKISSEIVRQGASTDPKYGYRGKPIAFMLVDAGTIKHVIPKQTSTKIDEVRWDIKEYNGYRDMMGVDRAYVDDIRYIQVDRYGERHAAYRESQMICAHAFESTDIKYPYQGLSIVEQSLELIRYFIDSVIYNYTRRSTGVMPKGMIHVEGGTDDGMSRREMALFRKLIWGISSGRKDHWKYPIVGTPKGTKASFIKFHDSSKDMEDFTWMATLVSIICSYAGLEPENLAMASQKGVLGKQTMFNKESEEGAMFRSQDEGLRFYLLHLSDIINSSRIVEEMTGIEGLAWKWVGLDVEDEGKKIDIDKKRLETTSSINDLLVASDKKTQEVMFGDTNIYDLPGVGNPIFKEILIEALRDNAAPDEEERTIEDQAQDIINKNTNPDANKSMAFDFQA